MVHDINTALRHGDAYPNTEAGELVANCLVDKVITEANLTSGYGVKGRIEFCSRDSPYTIIDSLIAPPPGLPLPDLAASRCI